MNNLLCNRIFTWAIPFPQQWTQIYSTKIKMLNTVILFAFWNITSHLLTEEYDSRATHLWYSEQYYYIMVKMDYNSRTKHIRLHFSAGHQLSNSAAGSASVGKSPRKKDFRTIVPDYNFQVLGLRTIVMTTYFSKGLYSDYSLCKNSCFQKSHNIIL